jgi:hypothetical protein
LALSTGRIPPDEEFQWILDDKNIGGTAAVPTSVGPDEIVDEKEEEDENNEDEDDPVEGEDVEEDQLSAAGLEDLLKDLIQYNDKKQFLSISSAFKANEVEGRKPPSYRVIGRAAVDDNEGSVDGEDN